MNVSDEDICRKMHIRWSEIACINVQEKVKGTFHAQYSLSERHIIFEIIKKLGFLTLSPQNPRSIDRFRSIFI